MNPATKRPATTLVAKSDTIMAAVVELMSRSSKSTISCDVCMTCDRLQKMAPMKMPWKARLLMIVRYSWTAERCAGLAVGDTVPGVLGMRNSAIKPATDAHAATAM